MGWYPPELRSTVLDVDWVWRRALPAVWRGIASVWSDGRSTLLLIADTVRLRLLDATSAHLSPWSRFGEPWPTGATAMWAAALLLAYLFLSY